MKKFYAFAAAALCALAANAQNGAPLYATGAGPAFDPAWAPETPAEFNWDGKEYTLELEGLTQIKISTAIGTWDEFNAGVYGCKYGDTPGVAVDLEPGYDANIEAPGTGDYTVTVAGDLSTITLTAKGEIDTSFPDVYLRGDMTGADWAVNPAWKFDVVVPEKVFKLTVPEAIAAGDGFKFADDAWNKVNCGSDGEAIMLDTETQVYNGGNPSNITLEEEFEGTIYLNLDLDGEAYVVFSTEESSVPEWADQSGIASVEADDNVAPVYFNLQGVKVANPENGLYIVVKGNKASKVLVK